jgi:hypothetical protein
MQKEDTINTQQTKPMKVNVGHTADQVLLILEPCPGCRGSVIATLSIEQSEKVREMLKITEANLCDEIIIPGRLN